MDAPYRIRSAVPADAAPLVAIERRCFSDPWSETSFRDALDSPWSFGLVANSGRGLPDISSPGRWPAPAKS